MAYTSRNMKLIVGCTLSSILLRSMSFSPCLTVKFGALKWRLWVWTVLQWLRIAISGRPFGALKWRLWVWTVLQWLRIAISGRPFGSLKWRSWVWTVLQWLRIAISGRPFQWQTSILMKPVDVLCIQFRCYRNQCCIIYMIYCMSPPPPSCKKKLSSVCVQIASCQFVVPFRPSDSSPEAELLFSPTHAWCIGSRVPFPNYPPQPLRVETHLLPHPYLSFPPPNPLPWNSLSPSGRSCSSHSVTNICTLFLC